MFFYIKYFLKLLAKKNKNLYHYLFQIKIALHSKKLI